MACHTPEGNVSFILKLPVRYGIWGEDTLAWLELIHLLGCTLPIPVQYQAVSQLTCLPLLLSSQLFH